MSNEVFPILPGLEWNSTKSPVFKTNIIESVSGREIRSSYQISPKFEISLSYEFLRESRGRNELQQIESFFIARRGAFQSFLLAVPGDDTLDLRLVSNGASTQNHNVLKPGLNVPFLYTKPKTDNPATVLMWRQNQNTLMWQSNQNTLMWSNVAASIGSSGGSVQLSGNIKQGKIVLFSFNYYYKVRFADDSQEYTNFMHKLWQTNKISFIGTLGTKI